MDWHCWIALLFQVSALIFRKNAAAFAELKEKRLAFLQHSKCTYSYEVAVHTARGSKSTESDGFQLHALVSTLRLRFKLLVVIEQSKKKIEPTIFFNNSLTVLFKYEFEASF